MPSIPSHFIHMLARLPWCLQVVADELMVLRDSLKPAAKAQGIKLTFLPIMVKVS